MNQPEDPNAIENSKLQLEKWRIIMDTLKWLLVSFVLAIVALVIESRFKDRNTGLQEMEIYDKYVHLILDHNEVQKQWNLTRYFIAVTPTDRLRDRWIEYQKVIEPEYEAYKALLAELESKEEKISEINLSDTIRNNALKKEVKTIDKEIETIQFKMEKINKRIPSNKTSAFNLKVPSLDFKLVDKKIN